VDLEKVVANLVHKVERRFYGKYRGFVVNNDDPKKLGRLELMVPSVLGPKVKTGWALPCVPYGGDVNQGFLCIPERGAGVWVEFEEGDLEFPIWVGTFWSEPGGKSELPKPNNADGAEQGSVQSPPTRKIFKTKRGHTVQFEDADGEERIIICDGERENRIVFSQGGLSIANKNNTIAMTDQGITINGAKHVCLDGLLTWLMNHTHVGNLGTPTPLNPADVTKLTAAQKAPDGDILSRRVTLG
jgi:Type VI secretion system/phage-baseplate injector OB domain